MGGKEELSSIREGWLEGATVACNCDESTNVGTTVDSTIGDTIGSTEGFFVGEYVGRQVGKAFKIKLGV